MSWEPAELRNRQYCGLKNNMNNKIENKLNTKPIVFWFINSEPDTEELRLQIREMQRHGIGGFFMHWMPGAPGYMSENWIQVLDIIIDEAQKVGMDAWLYDEAWCPSCYAGGRILAERPELQAKTLWSKKQDIKGGEYTEIKFDLMKIISIVALPIQKGIPQLEQAIDISEYAGPCAEQLNTPYRHDWGYYPFTKPVLHWRAAIKGNMRWQLKWQSPDDNDWRVYIFCQREMLQWENFNRLDVLNPESIKYFLKETHERYAEHFSSHFGKTIPGIMTDEFKFLPAAWTNKLPEYYQQRYNVNLISKLPALIDNDIPESPVVKANYHYLLSELFVNNYTIPMQKWCNEHNLILTGHISPEEHGTIEVKFAGNIAAHLKYFDMPGSDIIIHKIGDKENPVLNLSPRLASSVAHQQGISKVFTEAGACGNEDLSLEQFKYLFDWLMIHGINFINIHAFSYTLSGYEKFLAGQTISAYTNLLPHFEILGEYITKQCKLFTEFRPDPEIAVLKPMSALRAISGIYEQETEGEIIDRELTNLTMALIENHIDFDLLDEDDSGNWKIRENKLIVGMAKYKVVVIPDCIFMAKGAYDKLTKLANAGGQIICHNNLPQIISDRNIENCQQTKFLVSPTLTDVARKIINYTKPDISIIGKYSEYIQMFKGYNSDNKSLYFLLNTFDKPVDITLGTKENNVNLHFMPKESKVIQSALSDSLKEYPEKQSLPLSINQSWSVTAEKQNHIPLVSGMKIIIEDGAIVSSIICDNKNIDPVKNSFAVNGQKPDWSKTEYHNFYTTNNIILPADNLFKIGENKIEFNNDMLPTILLAGNFSAFFDNNTVTIKRPIKQSNVVSRISAGYPYLRGELIFENTFMLVDAVENAELSLENRKGSIEIIIDGESRGIVAWPPDRINIGDLPAGEHSIILKVIGDGIGILHEGAFDAGCSGINLFI